MQAAVGKCCVCCSPHWLPKATDSCSLELTCCTEHQSLPTSVSVHLSPVSTTVCHLSPCRRDTHWLLWGLLLLVRMETQKGDMTALPRRKHLECKLRSSLLLPQDHRIHKLPALASRSTLLFSRRPQNASCGQTSEVALPSYCNRVERNSPVLFLSATLRLFL